ncbi:hypothetical protein BDQ17DRAFT_1356961 [Cyathus striatus]|nr:hypothetical protein BDQ17DRAFT_1356961 [Cyathus striatus]
MHLLFQEELYISNSRRLAPHTAKVITLPSLHTLGTCDYDDGSEIFSILCVPKLANIRMMESRRNLEDISRMIEQSEAGTVMNQLTLQMISEDRDYFVFDVIEQVHDVKELVLLDMGSDSGTDTLKGLIWNPELENAQLLPSLQNFQLIIHPSHAVDARNLQSAEEFLRSRSSKVHTKNGSHTSVPLPLLFVKLTAVDVVQSVHVKLALSFTRLKDLGKELGIEVEVELTLKAKVLTWTDGDSDESECSEYYSSEQDSDSYDY